MCLIIAKPKGMPLPSRKRLKRWFDTYQDGFGISFQYEGRVRILKGAMTKQEMFELIAKMKRVITENGSGVEDVDIVIQYRQAMTGSVVPEYCHPFPISSSQEELDSTDVMTDCALAHNGVIFEYNTLWRNGGKDINDAQEFIKDYLVDFGDALYQPAVQKLIEAHTMSKFALLNSKEIHYIGGFIKDGGYLYSNGGYQTSAFNFSQGSSPPPYGGMEDYYSWGGVDLEPWDKHKDEGGIVCDGCGDYFDVVYNLPSYGGLGCISCYEYLEGAKPAYSERYF